MKKAWLLLLTAALLAGLVSCQTPDEELPPTVTDDITEDIHESETETEAETEAVTEAQTEVQTEPETEAQTDTQGDTSAQYYPYYGYDDIHDYLQQMWEQQIEQNGGSELNGQNHTLTSVLPLLKKDGYVGGNPWSASKGKTVFWNFKPIEYQNYIATEGVSIRVTVHRTADVYHKLTPENTDNHEQGAYLRSGQWYFLVGNHTVIVRLPGSELDQYEYVPFEKVLEYFDFEIVTYSPTAETGAVQ